MAITFVGSGVGTHAAVSAQTYNFSSLLNDAGGTPTLAAGDIVYVAVENSSTVDRGAGALVPSGYTSAVAADYRGDSNDSNFQVSYKVMGGTPDTSVAIPASNATTAGVAYAVYVFRGVNTVGGPGDATPTTVGAGNTGIANAPAIVPVTAGAWVVAFGGAAVAAGAVFTNPAGMSATTNHFRSTTITTTTNDANIGGALYTAWTSGSYDPAVFGGSTTTNTGSWSAVTLALKPVVSHAATGVLTGQGSVVAGTAQHRVKHVATGVLVGSGAVVAGTATRFRAHPSTGALVGQGAVVAGSASRAGGSVTHVATGALVGSGAVVAGTAQHRVKHTTTGVLVGQGSVVAGTATRFRAHPSTGAIIGSGAVVSGSAARSGAAVTHTASGALVGQGAVVSGTAQHRVKHVATGALVGAGAIIVGSAARSGVTHTTTGVLVGQGAVVTGASNHISAYPDPVYVLKGVAYGPGGAYVGTLDTGADIIKLDLATGRLVKQISTSLVLSL